MPTKLKNTEPKERGRNGGARAGAGRMPYSPSVADRETVSIMAAAGIPQESIARCIGQSGITVKTLCKHFRREMDIGLDVMISRAVGVVSVALANDEPWAACFVLKCRGGWRERRHVEHSGSFALPMIDVLEAGRHRAARAKRILPS